jgi:acyl carrier protein
MDTIADISPRLREYLDEARAPLPPISDPDQPLQIDSMGLIRLVAFMESDLGIRIEDEELLADNFAIVRSLGELIASKTPLEAQSSDWETHRDRLAEASPRADHCMLSGHFFESQR